MSGTRVESSDTDASAEEIGKKENKSEVIIPDPKYSDFAGIESMPNFQNRFLYCNLVISHEIKELRNGKL